MDIVKNFFKESVSFLASVLVLVAGSYYLAAKYIINANTVVGAVIYIACALSFLLLSLIASYLVGSEAINTYRRLRGRKLKLLLGLIIVVNIVGYIGTVAISAANLGAAVSATIPKDYTKPIMPPVIPENMTYGDSVVMNLDLLRALEQCNIDKAEIRKIEESRK
ncbi:Rz1-like lysis system protein LysC [Serratia fonticola]|uniref:Rz1-like lysis system protein LysC n=1 Tax=Serratia fonticola TaxID=47917 RepID=UPI001FD8006D|nr:hypothetical protein [Serratia fonticola]